MAQRLGRLASARLLVAALSALALVALSGCGGSSGEAGGATAVADAGVRLVSPADANEMLAAGGVTLLDVRTPEEFAAGHIEGAENVDFRAADFGSRLDELDRGARYVVYCHSGNRSGQSTALMAAKGFTDVTDVDGGIAAWQAAGLPVVTG